MFRWRILCAGCQEHVLVEVSNPPSLPLRCSVCGLLEGWSQDVELDRVFEVCAKFEEIFGPGVIQVGPLIDPEDGYEFFEIMYELPGGMDFEATQRLRDAFDEWFSERDWPAGFVASYCWA